MLYMKLKLRKREKLLSCLESMPEYLEEAFRGLTDNAAQLKAAGDTFSPVEQVWHLADLEVEGFGQRIRRLLAQTNPHFHDFDGEAIAKDRHYKKRFIEDGIVKFRRARRANIATIRGMNPDCWMRSGTQEGVGKVTLCDMPGLILQHDVAHQFEIEAWRKNFASLYQ